MKFAQKNGNVEDSSMEQEICKIYVLTNTINNKIYVGQTWLTYESRMGKTGEKYSHSPYIYHAIQKYGVENFEYKTLMECDNQQMADDVEAFFIMILKSQDPEIGYNLKDGGSAGKHSEENKAKISKTLKDIADNWTEEERKQRSAPISEYWLGKTRGPHTEEWKENNSIFMIERHKKDGHPMQGKHHTDETKQKISKASKGHIMPEELRQKLSDLNRMPVEREQGIIQAYLRGNIIIDIMEEFGVRARGIYHVLHRNDIPLRNPKLSQSKKEELRKKKAQIITENNT